MQKSQRRYKAKKKTEKTKHEFQLRSKAVEHCFRKHSNGLGGLCGGSPDGEFLHGTMVQIINKLITETKLNDKDIFLDCGGGRSGPGITASHITGCTSVSIEIEDGRHYDGVQRTLYLQDNNGKGWGGRINHMPVLSDLMTLQTVDPSTLMYMFNCGFPPMLLRRLASLFNNSQTVQWLVFTQDRESPHELGFHVENEPVYKSPSLRMRANGNARTLLVYRKSTPVASHEKLLPVAEGPVADAVKLVQRKARFIKGMKTQLHKWLYSGKSTRG